MVSLTLMLCLAAASGAGAAKFNWYWYGGNSENCWQTGQPGAPNQACDNTGANFLGVPGRMFDDTSGGISKDLTLSPSGDYCSYYRLGDTINQKDKNATGNITGWEPLSPLENYQEYDGHSNVCAASADTFGQVVTNSASGNKCWETCGMHHYASFTGQEGRNRPWNPAFGTSPSLVISAEAGVHTLAHSGSDYGAWGYVCAELKDMTPGNGEGTLEYCFEEWRASTDATYYKEEGEGECGSGPYVLVKSLISNKDSTYGTKIEGSSETFELPPGGSGGGSFKTKITEANLINAIKSANAGCAGWHLSLEPKNYALIGVEQGLEGWRELTTLGGYATNLNLSTEYTPAPKATAPYAFREPSTGNEDVFFKGGENALWQLAKTPTGEWTKNHIGGVLTSDPMGFIEPNGTMNIFYRGENNAIWQAYRNSNGAWSEYEVLPGAPLSAGKPYGYMEPNGTMEVYYCSTSHVISQLYFTGSSWIDPGMAVGEAAPCEGDPVAMEAANGNQNVFYRTTTGSVGQVWWGSSVGWHSNPLGGDMEGTPTVLQEPNGIMNVFFHKAGNELGQWWDGSSGWDETPLGGIDLQNPVAFNSSNGTKNGVQYVFYVNSYGTIGRWWLEEGHGWQQAELGEASEGSPTGFSQPNGNVNVYFFQGGTGAIDQWLYSGGKWNLSTVCPGPCG